MFKKLYIDWKGEEQSRDSQYKAIPKFYFKVHMFYHVKHISCHCLYSCDVDVLCAVFGIMYPGSVVANVNSVVLVIWL